VAHDDAAFGHSQLIWIIKPCMAMVLLDPGFSRTATFSGVKLPIFARSAINPQCFKS
jgi:hypothetical protein